MRNQKMIKRRQFMIRLKNEHLCLNLEVLKFILFKPLSFFE